MSIAETNRAAAEKLNDYRDDPILFVREMFGVEPDAWQADGMRSFRDNKRTALSACKGPGKSCMMAWAIWWFMYCHVDAKGIAISITAKNLRDNLWTELSKWRQKAPAIMKTFDINTERVQAFERPATWWLSARSFPQQADKDKQADTLAGLHGEDVFAVLDEVGEYPEGVVQAAEGIFANDVHHRLLAGGNPTSVTGPLYRMTTKDRKRWEVIHITGDPLDPNRSSRISLEWAQQMIDDWGRDSAVVMINVLGLFPPQGANQLIGPNDVTTAQNRNARANQFSSDARIWGLDPARYGDDAAALCRRQGIVCRKFYTWRGKNGVELAQAVGRMVLDAREHNAGPDALFVDVGGVGASAYDHLELLGFSDILLPIDFGGSPDDDRFFNKRSEIWWRMADWLKKKPANLPSDPMLVTELTGPVFEFAARGRRTKFCLETKEQMRKRGIESPNKADALALTFSAPVVPQSKEFRAQQQQHSRIATDYDPYGPPAGVAPSTGLLEFEYDPLQG